MKPNMPANTTAGERLDAGVVVLHVAVVDAARARDLILGVRQLGLQLLEVLGRAQLRVGLGDGEQPAERSGQRALGLRDLRRARGPAACALMALARACVTASKTSFSCAA